MAFEMLLRKVAGSELDRIAPARLDQEQRLEDRLARDPAILGMELVLIGRQVQMLCRILRLALCTLAPLLLFVPTLHADPFQTTYELIPAAPRYMEEVRLRVSWANYDCNVRTETTMIGNKITVAATIIVDLCPGVVEDFDLGRFPAGEYSVEVVNASGHGLSPPRWTTSFVVPNRAVPSLDSAGYGNVNYSDLWWNPEQSGWGVMITHRPDGKLFAAWFDYGQDGRPVWYTFLGMPTGRASFAGQVMMSHGPDPSSLPFVTSIGTSVVGEGTFAFGQGGPFERRYDKGRMSVAINGTVRESPIERFSFD